MSDAILLHGVQLPARLGVTSAERVMRRPVLLDLELAMDLRPAGRSDRIGDTVDYGAVYALLERVATEREHRLVEALASRIADALLAEFPLTACTVRVRKVAPIPGPVAHAGVRITRTRVD